ncbi:MAG: FAD-dependent oxidoreductase, partial [Actinomycetota bacterium]
MGWDRGRRGARDPRASGVQPPEGVGPAVRGTAGARLSLGTGRDATRPRPAPVQSDCIVVGGGLIGLFCARELARGGLRVLLLDRGQLGREASWAGAGV